MEIFSTWSNLPLIPKIYWTIAVISTIAFIVIYGLSLIGNSGDNDADTDSDVNTDHDLSSYILSLKSVIGFFLAASWVGIITINNQLPLWVTLLSSIIAGIIMTTIIVALLTFFAHMQYSGTLTTANTVGAKGEVYLSIPPSKSGRGKVQIYVQSALRTYDAITESTQELNQHDKIIVKSIYNNDTLIVEKIS